MTINTHKANLNVINNLERFFRGIPQNSRRNNVTSGDNYNTNINDRRRLIEISKAALEDNTNINPDLIKEICRGIGEEYSDLIETPEFDIFANNIINDINRARDIIGIYQNLSND